MKRKLEIGELNVLWDITEEMMMRGSRDGSYPTGLKPFAVYVHSFNDIDLKFYDFTLGMIVRSADWVAWGDYLGTSNKLSVSKSGVVYDRGNFDCEILTLKLLL